jgi:hypothetical protein
VSDVTAGQTSERSEEPGPTIARATRGGSGLSVGSHEGEAVIGLDWIGSADRVIGAGHRSRRGSGERGMWHEMVGLLLSFFSATAQEIA